MTHLQKWVDKLMEGLDKEVDKKTREKILENCGRSCISANFVKKAEKCMKDLGDEEAFFKKMAKSWPHFKPEGNKKYVVYDKCFCPIVKSYDGKLSDSWCNCSRGWVKELFETALERPVQVVLEKSIKRGDDHCRFRVEV